MIFWAVSGMLGISLLIGITIFIGVQVNGAGTLNRVDRIMHGFTTVSESAPISYGDHPQQRVFVLRDDAARGEEGANTLQPVIIFIHGGSWYHGDPEYYGFVGRALAPQGHIVVNAGYRLGDDGKYPAMLQDAADVVKWVRQNISDYGGDPDRIVLAGHSAGAYNAVMLALEPRWLQQAGLDPTVIKGVIGLAGPYDFLPLSGVGAQRAFGDQADLSITQPVNFPRADAPPMLLMTGEADETVRPRNTRVLAETQDAAGARVETHFYPAVSHTRIIMNFAKPWQGSSDIVNRVRTFVAENTKPSAPVQANAR